MNDGGMNGDGMDYGGMDDAVLLEVVRGDRVESTHRGTIVLLGADGGVEVSAGDPTAVVYPRSALKPLQATALVRAGWTPPDESLALASASHNGEAGHRDGARRTLADAGLDETALQCPPDLPWSRDALVAYVAGGGVPAPVCHNCSGKHAGMVATCVVAGWDVSTYLRPDHPLQVAIVDELERACGVPISASSVDGCGAPAHALPLQSLARGFAELVASPADSPGAAVVAAVTAHPWLLGGTGRAVTDLMAEVPGLVAKDGAEGVWAAALPDGRAFAAKVSDGAERALPPLLAAALRHWGHTGPAVTRLASSVVLGGGRPVGEIRWSPALRDVLQLD